MEDYKEMKLKGISSLTSRIASSAIGDAKAKIDEMKKRGIKIINFAQGQPDFDTPKNIKKAAYKAINEGFTKYTAAEGIQDLREAVCIRLKQRDQLEYKPTQIIITNGSKQALYNAVMALCEPDDEVLIPVPCWVTYPEQVKLARAKAIFVSTQERNNFRLTLDEIKSAYNPRVKVFLFNNPNNPTGALCDEGELIKIADFMIDKGIWVITDEIYNELIYNNKRCPSLASINNQIKKQTVTINGCSKTYAMTGWRVGYAAGPEKVISAMIKLQGHSTSGINSIAQKAAIEALLGTQEEANKMLKEYKKRKDYIVRELNSISGITCKEPDATFYVFPNISNFFGKQFGKNKINNDLDFTTFLLEEAHVAVVPGSAFSYNSNHIRMSFATSMENIKDGLSRIKKVLT